MSKGFATDNLISKKSKKKVFSNEPLNLYYVKENSSRRFYWGRRGPSVTLRYEFPENTNIKWMYSEVMIPEGYDKIGMFAMANGSDQGYFGIQVKSLVERWILFSIWSPYNTDNQIVAILENYKSNISLIVKAEKKKAITINTENKIFVICFEKKSITI